MTDSTEPEIPGDAVDDAHARPPRVRRQRSLRESLGSIVLAVELVVVFLGALVLFGLKSLSAPAALGGGAGLVILIAITVGLLRYPIGFVLGWLVQLIVLAAGFLVPAFFIVGAIFTAMWGYCMIAGGRIDRNDQRARAAAQAATAGSTPTDNDSPRETEKPE